MCRNHHAFFDHFYFFIRFNNDVSLSLFAFVLLNNGN